MNIDEMQAVWRKLRDEADAAIDRRDEMAERIAWEQSPFKEGDAVMDEKGRLWLVVGVRYWDDINDRVEFYSLDGRAIGELASIGKATRTLYANDEPLEKVAWTNPAADRAEKGGQK